MSAVEIRPATVKDVPLILGFIKKLAEYEKLLHEVVATEELLAESLFGAKPYAEVIIASARLTPESELKPAGMALFFHNFSTFLGSPGLYLEDLYVDIEFRGKGIGKKLLTQLAVIAKERSCKRYEWVCLDWNKPSREFYESLGAKPQSQWIIHRVEGKSLDDLATL
ncbi:acyl-CoA N-acyltransferase [Helicostylum pulchrum]|uniref:N-acetyltransferase domain-containing protein n=1 Tax=Helicostylum pulchrum TaxID=562976 RepID=A0ABP9XZ14_9FUNG|nr:acyl-CoA N-acyltransferase [Helicostylum pulchrum]